MVWCSEYGLSESQAHELLKALHLTGQILHFHNNDKLKDVIFLNPANITEQVVDALDLKFAKYRSFATKSLLMIESLTVSVLGGTRSSCEPSSNL